MSLSGECPRHIIGRFPAEKARPSLCIFFALQGRKKFPATFFCIHLPF
jgi:hypothetical protein